MLRFDQRGRKVRESDMQFECLAEGEWFEGIAVEGDTVWYSDVFARGIRRHPPAAAGEVWRGEDRWIAALMINQGGEVLSGGATGIEWFHPKTGASGRLFGGISGEPFGGVNEMVADASGALYFGTVDSLAFENETVPAASALYRLDPSGEVQRLTGDLKFSNGLALSPDGKQLYHCESFVGVFAYDVLADGSLGEGRMLLEKSDCDGLKVDAQGRLWIAGFQTPELVILRPDGSRDGGYALPGQAATNHHFGGSDLRDIYMSVVIPVPVGDPTEVVVPAEMHSGLWRGKAPVAGLPLHPPRFRLG
jgi:sugar lactone lactonase YvrE